jgi:hypothetical protein
LDPTTYINEMCKYAIVSLTALASNSYINCTIYFNTLHFTSNKYFKLHADFQ